MSPRKAANVLLAILLDSLRPIKLVMAFLAFWASVGFALQAKRDPFDDLLFMIQVMPWWAWSGLFALQAIGRFTGLIFGNRGEHSTYIIPSLGIWLWSMLFTSAAITSPMEGMSLLYIVPALIEVWILGRAITEKRDST